MKTKLYLILIPIFIGIKGYSQDTIANYTSLLDMSNPQCPSGINLQQIGDTLNIFGTIGLTGCGKQVAIIKRMNDSIFIKTTDITNGGADCEIAYNACFKIKIKTLNSDSILKFNGIIFNITNKIKSDSIPTYKIAVNDTVQLDLTSNPSTGYAWMWTNKQSDSIADTINCIYVPDTPISIGSGGKMIWKFKVKKIGIDTIKLEYKRPSVQNSTIETVNIIIQVNDSNNVESIFSVLSGLSDDKIKIYPNPTNDKFTIQTDNQNSSYCLKIYNTFGQIILNKKIINSVEQVDLSGYPVGVYLVKVVFGNQSITKKVCIIH